MKPNAYYTLAAQESDGWYYAARRRAVAQLIERYVLPERMDRRDLRILDVGCGTGGTTVTLEPYGVVQAIEPSPLAIELAHERFPHLHILPGGVDDLPKLLPAHAFDLATIMGVLVCRAVKDPLAALKNVRRALVPGGYVIWNEAAYPYLSRQHVEFVEASRRFYPSQMRTLVEDAGLEWVDGSHLLGWGFPIALGLSALHRVRRTLGLMRRDVAALEASDDRPLPGFVNRLLERITYAEWRLGLAGLRVPFGVSYLLIARKPLAAAENVVSRRAA